MHDSDLELNEISDFKVNFHHSDDSDTDNTHAAVHNIDNIEQDGKFTDFILKMSFLLF